MENGDKKEKKRRSGRSKALDLVLRVLHVGVASVLFGGVILAVPFTRLFVWHTLAVVTGGSLIVAGICQCRHWPYQGRGLMALVHVGLLVLVHYRLDLIVPVATAVLAFGFLGSNMPGYLRHWSVVHGRKME